MIIKSKDDCQDQIDYLTDLLERDFSDKKKSLIERELKYLYSGKKGEETSAYYLEFDFRKSSNWALIHDLRLEHDGDVAQIDHLLIGRMMDVYVIESKNFNSGVSISDEGDFSYFYKNRPYSIPSPIAQNERHIRLLDRFLTANQLLPKRLGMTLNPNYRNIVLVSPKSRLTKPKQGTYDCSGVMKSDQFLERFTDDLSTGSMLNLAKVISQQSLHSFAERLALSHEPITVNYLAKFGLEESDSFKVDAVELDQTDVPECPKCKKEMVKRSANRGKNIDAEFWGCRDFPNCRGVIKIEKPEKIEVTELSMPDGTPPLCPKCDGDMTKRSSKKGKNPGQMFWGCNNFPKCFGSRAL